jgi:radical SAM protein with 4Fe4S-binding SPASM domain
MSTLGARPRSLPIAPKAGPSKRRLPLADDVRPQDGVRPIYAVWEITLACDLACRHCGSRAGKGRPDELSTEECFDLIDQMRDLNVKEVTIIGGEAYLRDDWLDIVRRIRGNGMQCSMTTGGRNLTLERAKAAKEAGLLSVSVSVDGLKDAHDDQRGVQGSFESALQAMRNLKEAGIPFSCNTQINKRNLHEIPQVFEVLADAGMHSWQVQITTAMGRAGDEKNLLLEPYQMLEVLPLLARLQPLALARKIRIWPGNNIGYYGPYEQVLRGRFPGGHRGSCSAGRLTLGIEANGDIKGCPSLPTSDYVGGNVRDAKLKDIWERSAPLRFTRDQTVEDLKGFCRTCYYAEECKAGCNWTSHVLLGYIGDNPYCHHRALELLAKGERETIEKKQQAPGEPFDYSIFEIHRSPWPEAELERARALVKTGEGFLSDG